MKPFTSPTLAAVLSERERALLQSTMSGARLGLEFGMGGSTLLAAQSNVERYYSVESDPQWILQCATHPRLAELIAAGRWMLFHADIGPTGHLGYPEGTAHIEKWPSYHSAIWPLLPKSPDFIFIDGRFRLACALQAAARCEVGTVIAIHDYTDRPQYHAMAQFLEPVASADTLQVFRLTERPDPGALAERLSAAFLIPG